MFVLVSWLFRGLDWCASLICSLLLTNGHRRHGCRVVSSYLIIGVALAVELYGGDVELRVRWSPARGMCEGRGCGSPHAVGPGRFIFMLPFVLDREIKRLRDDLLDCLLDCSGEALAVVGLEVESESMHLPATDRTRPA
jgi:hypothetical protein